MKLKKYFVVAFILVALLLTSCGQNDGHEVVVTPGASTIQDHQPLAHEHKDACCHTAGINSAVFDLLNFGDEAEVLFQAHNWPRFGNDHIIEYMVNTAAIYKFINDQVLMYINQGFTSSEIAHMIRLPDSLERLWYTRPYYGTLQHNARAVYLVGFHNQGELARGDDALHVYKITNDDGTAFLDSPQRVLNRPMTSYGADFRYAAGLEILDGRVIVYSTEKDMSGGTVTINYFGISAIVQRPVQFQAGYSEVELFEEEPQASPIPLTRGDLLLVMYYLFSTDSANGLSGFYDIDETVAGAHYSAAVAWAAENGITSGVGNNEFGKHNLLTKEQFVTLMFRVFGYLGLDTTSNISEQVSERIAQSGIAPWAQEAMEWAIYRGFFTQDEIYNFLNPVTDQDSTIIVETIVEEINGAEEPVAAQEEPVAEDEPIGEEPIDEELVQTEPEQDDAEILAEPQDNSDGE